VSAAGNGRVLITSQRDLAAGLGGGGASAGCRGRGGVSW
jgi:hypothetical protein